MSSLEKFSETFPLKDDDTSYHCLTSDYVSIENFGTEKILVVQPKALEILAQEAFRDTSHLLRTQHLKQLQLILKDHEASTNDKFVALQMIKNANTASGFVLPLCQDTGTCIIMGKKGQHVFTREDDRIALSQGIKNTYETLNLRYSQLSAQSFFEEVNTQNNLPAQIDLYATQGSSYKFMFMAKGGGSANKTFLFQKTKALLSEKTLLEFLKETLPELGTSACPPYHLSIVIGGMSAEQNLKTVKLASAKYLDSLPFQGGNYGQAFRDIDLEEKIFKLSQTLGIGAQFGGKYFCHDVRIIRLPRHGASCPVGIGVSCAADRQVLGKITEQGIFLETLERNPAQFLPEIDHKKLSEDIVHINLEQPMEQICQELSKYPIKTRITLTGTLIVARDIAHAKLKERLEAGAGLPDFFKNYPIYYAGPAKTPSGYASGSFGPTTAGRMDSYVELFQKHGGSLVMIAKGNRSKSFKKSCQTYGGFYLGSIGGVAAELTQQSIKKIEVIEYPELGMEAIWKIQVVDFPAFIVVDDKGNDFFEKL